GRLVFFYPVLRGEDGAASPQFPEHPCFKLIASCEQILSYRYSRVLLTMVKVAPYTEEIARVAGERHPELRENHQKSKEMRNHDSAVFEPAQDGKHDKDFKP